MLQIKLTDKINITLIYQHLMDDISLKALLSKIEALKPGILKSALKKSKTCFDCDQIIREETIEKYPDTEICEECIECE